jgi:endonuclease YncB( thermonuclease family)
MDKKYEYLAKLIRLDDGDSGWFKLSRLHHIDVGFRVTQVVHSSAVIHCRLLGIDAPEVRGKKANPVPAKAAKERLHELLSSGDVRAVTHKPDPGDKYGRWLVDLYVQRTDENNHVIEDHVNQILLDEGLVKPYPSK